MSSSFYEDDIVRIHFYTQLFADLIENRPYVPLCGKTIPGFEIETILNYAVTPLKSYWLSGQGVKPVPRQPCLTQNQYYALRGGGIVALRGLVESGIEELIGQPCRTSQRLTCSVAPTSGRIRVELLVPGSAITGRPDQWERSYWEIFPHWTGAVDEYQIQFDLPITAVRRWPVRGEKPSSGFVALDYDAGFESFRLSLMSLCG